jgi:hypothetical protein
MRQLVALWIEAEKTGYRNSLGEAIEILNRESGLKLNYSRLAEWRRGKYVPSPRALSWMMYRALIWALVKADIPTTTAQRDALERLIWKLKMTNGERNIELV